MNTRIIGTIIGRILCVEGLFMIPAIAIALFCGELREAGAFAVTIVILLAIGFPLSKRKLGRYSFYAKEGFVTVGLTWILVSFFGAMPSYFSGAIPSFVDCFFETVSGFTTTGASVLSAMEGLPYSILYWRSFSVWLGGMGVLVFVLAVGPLGKEAGYSMHILRAESTGPNVNKLVPRIARSAKILYMMYIALTIIQLILLMFSGMPKFDALCISFSTAGTGGFAVLNDSVGSYSPYVQWVTTIFMLLFSINFYVYFLLLAKEFKRALSGEEFRTFIIIVVISTLLVTFDIRSLYGSFSEALRYAAFQVSTIISTTGFTTADFNVWPQFSRNLLLLLMIVGACSGSTGGGIKVTRVLILAKSIKKNIMSALRPNSVNLAHIDGELVEESTIDSVNSYLTIYLAIIIVSTLLISLEGFSFETGFSSVIACLNNIGPGLGEVVGATGNYGAYSNASKLLLSLNMLLGRLELFPIIILFTPAAWRK